MPSNRSGRDRPAPIAVIDSDTQRLEFGEHLLLDLEFFDDRLDHQHRRCEPGQFIGNRNAIQQRAAFSLVHAAALDQFGETAGNLVDAFLRGAGANVIEQHRVAGLRRNLGDASTHRTRADDGDYLAAVQCRHVSSP